ncbi:proline--tRNA ligase [Candidatus Methanosphaera massiliense]|uniref:proline--tRNA ligase n=1 Tax=Candidatus Methanosphaera massiliense TaxID=3017187 RepID=UPI000DC2B832|nr:proline--tRNA ligase [Candidatus Methanosphaera massiliense]MDD6285604.1 proline--tRNA ligase [Methanobacteriaceae archaeon]MDE4079066.1 proline--tRNA ligase [Candidatus Methanosphaera massiliense]MDY2744825.1 proline--tRNA ligase [Methanosphaera sp.]RAP45862.1 MAG: proline--tRNA ligase [Methanosphaera sp. SHI1033]
MKKFSEWFHNILEEAELIDSRYPIKGMSVWLPRGFQIRKYALKALQELLDKDHEEVLFPMLIPESELAKEAIHVKGFEDEVYWVTKGGKRDLNEQLALRPTSETSMYPMFSLWVRSHMDLPIKVYQTVNTFRYETKHTRPLIRVREITTFNETHTVHATEEEAEEEVKTGIEIYKTFFDELGIPYSISKRPEWDKFPGSKYTMAFDMIMPDGKTLQIGTVHNLGTTFAKTFDIEFENDEGEHEYAHQTCYGLSDRVIAALIAAHGDEKGLQLPPVVAPEQVVIVPIIFKENQDVVLNFTDNLEKLLKSNGIRVRQDKRDMRPGKKYYEWEKRGVPLRIEVGPRDIENKSIVLIRRDTGNKEFIDYDENTIADVVRDTLDNITEDMKVSANKFQEEKTYSVENLEQVKKTINKKGGIVTFNWCGDTDCGKDMEEKFDIDVLGTQEADVSGPCLNCGKEAHYKALISKTY